MNYGISNRKRVRLARRLPFELLEPPQPLPEGVGLQLDLRTLWEGRRQHSKAAELLGPLLDVDVRTIDANQWGVAYAALELGVLTLGVGYAWDGPSGPALNTEDFWRASAVHDALYQFMRMFEKGGGYVIAISTSATRDRIEQYKRPVGWRASSDRVMKAINWIDGMGPLRRNWTLWGVRLGGDLRIWDSGVGKVKIVPDKFREMPT